MLLVTRHRSGILAAPLKVCVQLVYDHALYGVIDSKTGISTRRMVYGTGLLNLHFSLPHGNFLLGYHFHYKTGRMVSLERYRKDSVPVPPPDQETANDPEMSDIEMDTDPGTGPPSAAHAGSTQLLLAREHQHTLPSSDTLTLGGSNGVPELSTIRTYGDGAVVLKRLSSLVDAETCLIYLPDFNGANTSVSILDGGDGGQDTVRMVLTTDFEDSYTWDNPLNRQPATIITRPIQSIQQYKLPNGRHRIVSLLLLLASWVSIRFGQLERVAKML